MPMPSIAVFIFELLLIGLVWAVWVVLNLWIWQKSKAGGNLLMMIGAAVLAFTSIILAFGEALGGFWLNFFALLALTAGFYLSVKPMVAAHLAALQAKMKSMGKGSGTPPAGGGAPPPAQ